MEAKLTKIPRAALIAYCSLVCATVSSNAATKWTVTDKCSWGTDRGTITVSDSGAIKGRMSNGSLTGSISGSSVQMQFKNWLNKATMIGRKTGSRMSGTYTQSLSSETCTWTAVLTGPGADDPPASQDSAKSSALAAGKEYERQARQLMRSANCDNIKEIDYLIARASVSYKRAGDLKKNEQLNRIGEKISGEGGVRDRCAAKRKKNVGASSKPKLPASNLTKDQNKALRDACRHIILEIADRQSKGLSKAEATKQLKASGCTLVKYQD